MIVMDNKTNYLDAFMLMLYNSLTFLYSRYLVEYSVRADDFFIIERGRTEGWDEEDEKKKRNIDMIKL